MFREQVGPLLKTHCLPCHGGEQVKSGLDLAARDGLLKGGEEGAAIVVWNSRESKLLKLVRHEQQPHMPQKAPKLSDTQIAALAAWVDSGAPYTQPLVKRAAADPPKQIRDADRQFWSFQPLRATLPPRNRNRRWARTAIDQFILAKLEEKRLAPNPPADRRALIRRAYLGVIGLPPTPEEVEAFVADQSRDAWEKVVDRLLASPHYGERWARHWLDAARFAESHGYEQDYDRPHAFWYRDFVIRALNDDMPYHQFVRWQLAGDEIAPDEPWAWAATGFLGAGQFPTQLTEAEFESARYDELDDMVSVTGSAMLGLTVGCARCHDHKYDPIPTEDYYRLAATFTTTIRSEIELPIGADGARQMVMVSSEGFHPIKHHADERGFPHFYKQTFFLKRGDPKQKQGEAPQGFVQVLSRAPDARWLAPTAAQGRSSLRRRALADWITDVEYGAGDLLARVVVNRLWHHHLGRGIVGTPNDFGAQGERPTHPELLDWLAKELQRNGWRLKPLHKLILTSAVYQQSSALDAHKARADPENRLLWRYNRRRLEAEVIRDSMLAVSGLLDPTMFGKGSLDQTMTRRSIYFFQKRSQLIPFLQLFDAPEPTVSVGARVRTTIAPQALALMNSPLARACARGFSARVTGNARLEMGNPQSSISILPSLVVRAYALALGRPPDPREWADATAFLQSHPNPDEALADFCQVLLSLNEFVYVE